MECQIASKEERARDEERRVAEENENRIKDQYAHEIQQLQESINKLKKVDHKLTIPSPYEREVESLKRKLGEISQENSSLKMNLTEAETNLKLLQSQMVEMKVENDEKLLEYQRNEDAVSLVLNEQSSITKQVESLNTNNRRLIDSNDGLREALEAACRERTRQQRRSNGSVLQNDAINPRFREYGGSGRSSQASSELDALAQCDPGMQLHIDHDYDLDALNGYAANVKTAKDILNSISDSGIGTVLDDQYELDMWDSNGFLKRPHGRSQSARASMRTRGARLNASFRSDRPYKYNKGDDTPHGSISPRSDEENLPLGLSSSQVLENELRASKQSHRGSTSSLQRKVLTPDITLGHNDKIYKVVLCGDAGVGKSSFIFRLCKNKFKRHTTSTLGVDFQMKTVQLEHDESVSLQLWDTAGQERFRSISASYFRRAQGALLLYDCTIPTSFINLRDWMETISTEIPNGAPIMIIGNKIDLRDQYIAAQRHVVSSKEGAQLAASYGVLFMETSAADGQNIITAITMLARHLNVNETNNNEDQKIKTLSIDGAQNKSKCCQQS